MYIRTVTTNHDAALALWEKHQDMTMLTNGTAYIVGRQLYVWLSYHDITPNRAQKAPESPTSPLEENDVPESAEIERRFTQALWHRRSV